MEPGPQTGNELFHHELCPNCRGTGIVRWRNYIEQCAFCEGVGWISS